MNCQVLLNIGSIKDGCSYNDIICWFVPFWSLEFSVPASPSWLQETRCDEEEWARLWNWLITGWLLVTDKSVSNEQCKIPHPVLLFEGRIFKTDFIFLFQCKPKTGVYRGPKGVRFPKHLGPHSLQFSYQETISMFYTAVNR